MAHELKEGPHFAVLSSRTDNRKNGLSILLACLLFLLETILFYFFIKDYMGLKVLLLAHGLLSLLALLFVIKAFKKHEDMRFPLLLFLAIFGAGPFGLAGFLLFACLYPLFSKMSTSAGEWFKGLFPEEEWSTSDRSFQRIKVGWDDYHSIKEISSFQDLFTYGSLLQKQSVLDAVVKDFKPTYAPILKEALEYPSNVIRLQAAAIIDTINENYEVKLQDLHRARVENPEDASILLQIAELLDEQTSTGIFGKFRQNEIVDRAVDFYRAYLQKKPLHRMSLFAIGRLLFQNEKYTEFLLWCKEYEDTFKDLPAIAKTWKLESEYKLKMDYESKKRS